MIQSFLKQTKVLLVVNITGKLPSPPPPRKVVPTVRVGVWLTVRVSFRVGGQPDNCPGGKLTPVRVRGWVMVSFGVGGNFPPGQLS